MKNTHKLYIDVIAKSGSKNEPLEVTANGTYEAPKGIGYSPVKVNVKLEGNPLQYVIDNQGGDGIPRCFFLFNSYKGTSLDNVIVSIDTSNVTNMSYMFNECINLKNIPLLDTHNVTEMSSMFNSCIALETIPKLDTSNVTNMIYMFGYCRNLISIPLFDTSSVTDMSNMFYSCNKLTTIPELNTSKVTNMKGMFSMCTNLITIPQLDASSATNMNNIFNNCRNLSEIHMTGMKVSFDISASTKFTREALIEILNNLATVTNTKTLTMGSTNLAKLTDEDKTIATNKGWTLA